MPPELQGVSLSLLTFPSATQCSFWAAAVQVPPALWVTGRKAASAGPSLHPEYTCRCVSASSRVTPQSGPSIPSWSGPSLPYSLVCHWLFFFPLLALTTTCNFLFLSFKKYFKLKKKKDFQHNVSSVKAEAKATLPTPTPVPTSGCAHPAPRRPW